MSKLTFKQRGKLKDSEFALESQRKYPVDTKNRAANAKARAQQQFDKGNLSKDELSKIDKKANGILNMGKGKKPKKLGLLNQ